MVAPTPETIGSLRKAKRLCFFAFYHADGIVADHVMLYLCALRQAGFDVVVSSTAEMPPEEQAKLAAECALLVMRANTGLDFGGWIEAVMRFFPIEAELLLFTNDSVYAPVGDLPGFIDRLTAVPADFYGAIESFEFDRHLQSWFLLFRPSAYRSPVFLDLLARPIPAEMTKLDIIETYEVGLTRKLESGGLTYHAAYSPPRQSLIGRGGHLNAAHTLWRELIERGGIPFLKAQLLLHNPFGTANLEKWPEVVGRISPSLRDAIAADLARRRSAGGAGAPIRWRDTLTARNPFRWPELQAFLRRDFHTGRAGLARQANRLVFRVAIRLAHRARHHGRRRWSISLDNDA